MVLLTGNLKTMSKEEGSEDFCVYRDQFMEEWGSSQKQAGNFKLNLKKYQQAINKWLRSN